MPTRREILTKIGVGAASTAAMGAGGVALATHTATLEALGSSAGQAPWWLIHPLQNRDSIGLGWSVSNLGPVHKGAAILELTHRMGQGRSGAHLHLRRQTQGAGPYRSV